MSVTIRLLLFVALVGIVSGKHEEYIGWKSYYVELKSQTQLKTLRTLTSKYEIDALVHPILDREGILIVKPEHQKAFEQEAKAEEIAYRIHVDDIKRHLDHDDRILQKHRRKSMNRSGGRRLPYDSYQEIEVINDYLDYIGETYPNVAKVVDAANSFEGRPIKYVKISTTNFEDESKPIIYIDGGMHGRERISPPPVTWAIHKLVENVTEKDLLERFDWILLPVANPDGYQFTFTTNRLWRKSCSNDQHLLSTVCLGVDLNRNFDFYWNTAGTSDSPCSDTYAGSKPFSEVEARVVRDILHENVHRMAMYVSFHSFGSMILYPWGSGHLPPNAVELREVATVIAEEINKHSIPDFPRYFVGNSALMIGNEVSGDAEDYAYNLGVPLAFTIKLPYPKVTSSLEGYLLDPMYIGQVCRETWEGLIVGARKAGDLFKDKNN
ncbi:unnamed protein product [Chrysodeixis includens]|uniref:Peptidase M14 domain-containing protein n=1 Tax=Chrysodeixis includens TaxID=689277 RepID=A0A9P0FRP4_CHRIL|nr:unnamed protein product [Chrysodeixis includens]